jgi:hypothetical protein
VIDVVVVEVDGSLDEAQAKGVSTKVQVLLRIIDRGGHVVQAENREWHGDALRPVADCEALPGLE